MRIPARVHQGLRVLVELALRHGQRPVMLESLSTCAGGSRKSLYNLLTTLKGAELVRSVRGVGGGFALARDPEQITVHEIVRALEDHPAPPHCQHDGQRCAHHESCVAREVCLELEALVERALSGTRLSELAERQRRKRAEPPMFHI